MGCRGSVTLVKSNAKALLTLRIKSALALSEGERGLSASVAAFLYWVKRSWQIITSILRESSRRLVFTGLLAA